MTTKDIGLKQVYPTADGISGGSDSAIVEIIAIHGVNGHRQNTFTSKGHFWLRDSLPNWIPDSRVFTYGYNSDIFFSNSSSDLSDWSQKLLHLLNRSGQPLKYYNSGIVKVALVEAKLNPEYKDIGTSTSAVIFLATPHGGSELKDYAKVLEAIGMAGNTVRNGPLELLKEKSRTLQNLTQQFRHQSGGLEIVSFFEQIPTKGDILVEKTSAVLNLPSERQLSAEVDHANICKFSKEEDDDEIATMLREELVYIFDKVARRAEKQKLEFDLLSEEIKCFQSLYTSNYKSHWERVQRPVQGTCTWFLRHETYITWRDKQASSILLVTADPGCGKSVLSSFLVDKLPGAELQAILPGTVCYFFFKDDNDQQKSATFCLCALLHQLFTAKHSLIKHAVKEFKAKGDKSTEEISTLWEIFRVALTDPNCGNVICVIDGLDECEEVTRNQLLDSFARFYTQPELRGRNTDSFLKVIVTSRPYQSIEGYFTKPVTIKLGAENEIDFTSADIELVIDARVKELASKWDLSDNRQKDLHNSLSKGADLTFLWVSLILDMLKKTPTASKREFDKILNNLPRNLDAVYEKILENSPDSTEARKILHIVVAAARQGHS